MSTTSAQTPLSPEDFDRLVILLEHNGSLLALRRATSAPYAELFRWRQQPHIDEAVRAATSYEDAAARAEATQDLQNLRKACEDPVERRRLNCAILRALDPARRSERKAPAAGPAAGAASSLPLLRTSQDRATSAAPEAPVTRNPHPASAHPATTTEHRRFTGNNAPPTTALGGIGKRSLPVAQTPANERESEALAGRGTEKSRARE